MSMLMLQERRRQIEMAEREQDVRRMQEYAALVEEQERKLKQVFEAFAKKQELLAKVRVM